MEREKTYQQWVLYEEAEQLTINEIWRETTLDAK